MAADWQNSVIAADVDNSGFVSLADLLVVVADLRDNGVGRLLPAAQPGISPPPYLNVDGDMPERVSLSDALAVVDPLRQSAGLPGLELDVSLLNDDGESNADRITSDPTLVGQITTGLQGESRLVAMEHEKGKCVAHLVSEVRLER